MSKIALAKGQNNTTTNYTSTEPAKSPNITTSPTISPTTSKPTTVSPTTPTPTIPPTQSPDIWTGNVTENNNTCINIKFKAQITIKYNTSKAMNTTAFNIPANALVIENKSHCSNKTTETIFISFVDEGYTSADLVLTFNNSNGNVFVEEIELTFNLTEALFPDYFNKTLRSMSFILLIRMIFQIFFLKLSFN